MSVLLGSQQISAATLATAQTLTIPTGTVLAKINSQVGNVRYTLNGTPPTSSSGTLLAAIPSGGPVAASELVFRDQFSAAVAQFILSTAGAALNVLYYGYVD